MREAGRMNKTEIDMCLNCGRAVCDSGNCLRMMTLRRREARKLTLAGRPVTQQELRRICHLGWAELSRRIKQGMTGDQIVEYYGGGR